jgi:site-specific DNA recombinase
MKAAGYVRVSTEHQAREHAYPLDAQRQDIEAYCEADEIECTSVYQDTSSGALTDRPGLLSLMELTKTGQIERVIVPKLDMLSRKTMYCLWIEKELRKIGVELVSIAEPYRWDDPMQKMMLTIVAAFAEYEKELIKGRLSGGRKAKARKGGYEGGRPCIGYRAKRADKILEVDDEKAETVKRVFELRDTQPKWFLKDTAEQLNAEGHTTARGGKFHPTQVKRIVDRRDFNEGSYSYAGIEAAGQHTSIL